MAISQERGSGSGYLFLVLLLLSTTILVFDLHTQFFSTPRQAITWATSGLYKITNSPIRLVEYSRHYFRDRNELEERLDSLETEYRLLVSRSQSMEALEAVNSELRETLGLVERDKDVDYLAAELVGLVRQASRNEIFLNRGEDDGVTAGMAIVDALGVYGQVVEVWHDRSTAILVTDERLAVPVRVLRSGLNAIARGVGNSRELTLEHAAITADVKVGDLLVASGLGGIYPFGFPVATVTSIEPDASKVEARVYADPTADIHRRAWLLIVVRAERE